MDDVSANPSSGSEQDPVALIEGILEREDSPPTKAPRSQKPEPEPEQPEQPEQPEPGPETPPDEGEDEEQEPEQPPEEPELYVVKIDGKEQQVTRDELLAGYQRQADYSRKTAAAAEARREAEQLAQSVAEERQHYSQQLDQIASILHATLPPRPPPEMRDQDPIGYMAAKEDWETRVQQLQGVLGERERVQQQTQAEMQQRHQQSLASARQQLLEALPEWREPEKAKAGQRELADYLRTVGYADHEIEATADPRAVVGFRKAMLYDRLMASAPAVQQRVAQAPRMVKPGAAGPAPDQRKAVINQLKRSGGKDLDAAARLIELG